MSLLFDVIVDLPEGIAVVPVFAADKSEASVAGKELFPSPCFRRSLRLQPQAKKAHQAP